MGLKINNLIETSEIPKVGQRVVQVAQGVWLPVGMAECFSGPYVMNFITHTRGVLSGS